MSGTESELQNSFDAFFQSKEETLQSFLQTFVQLSAVERAMFTVTDLNNLDNNTTETITATTTAANTLSSSFYNKNNMNNNNNNDSIPTAPTEFINNNSIDTVQFAAAIQAFREKENSSNINSNNINNNSDNNNNNNNNSSNDNSGKLPICVDSIELEETVILDESEALKTGAMNSFFNKKTIDIMPSFDNFIVNEEEEEEEENENINKNNMETEEIKEVNKKISTQEKKEEKEEEEELCNNENKTMTNEKENKMFELDEINGGCEEDMSDVEIELPGLTIKDIEKEENKEKEKQMSSLTGHSHITLSTMDIKTLQEDNNNNNNEIQPFVLDAKFDYDTDIVGKSARLYPRLRI